MEPDILLNKRFFPMEIGCLLCAFVLAPDSLWKPGDAVKEAGTGELRELIMD